MSSPFSYLSLHTSAESTFSIRVYNVKYLQTLKLSGTYSWHSPHVFKTFSQINSFHSAVFSRCFGIFLIRDGNGLKMTKKKLVVKCEIYVEIPSDSCILAGIYSNGWFAMGWHFNDLAFKHHFREYMTRPSQITSVDAWHMNVKVYGLSHLLTRKGDKLDRTQTHCVYSRESKCEHIFYISKYYQ